ncbi:putative bifunctional diguanylate cyclase/phosphodiesterase [Jidongwangia harbinensis]|uniref:putative bifunctional diguanylate cyclase/phosphodiesterase n=1 Tax=Jidongwangia harbinensis TaxID=2878561 RepID=UPI001CD99CD2|nr:bifunctional diguanylate cyclase/phosphodiesterase [Jidongwangia harbinensis]MCA2214808.1 bifunctional diguanylate cyclase/phosphodiesterase [Jidongwangia harbinensis]
MTGEEPLAERLRPTPVLVTAAVLLVAAAVLFAVNLAEPRVGPFWSWMPAVLGTAVAGLACWQTAAKAGPDRHGRRIWRQFALVCALVTCGLVGDTRQMMLYPHRLNQQQHDAVTSIVYVLAMLVLLWALLRLPMARDDGTRQMFRFLLDAATVSVTMGIFGWYSTAGSGGWGRTDPVPLIVLAILGLIGSLAFVKVAVSGLGGLDRGTVRLLAAGAAVGALGGGLFPMLVDVHPGLSGSQLFVPATMLLTAFAADRQRRAAHLPRPPQQRRATSLVPYLAVAATDGLLLTVSEQAGGPVLTVALAAVILTVLVVVRQVVALRDNARLLSRVDTNLLQLNRYQSQLTHRATHDDLTDLANRALFGNATRDALDAFAAERSPETTLSLALIDLDDFKAINDRLGHAVGDALLVVVAQRLRECVRTDDVVARLGGDEFGLLLHGLRSDEATEVLARITDALSRPVHALGYDLLVSASVGLAEVWPDATPQELLRRADLAMYAAKERGKGRHAVYDAELEKHQAADAEMGAALRQALDRGEFTLVYQPIVRLPDGAWTGMETLVRWHHPDRGFIRPDLFIPIAERTGLIIPLGDWILRTALRQAAEWDARYGPHAPREIGVNVSARQLREPGFADDVKDALAATGFDPERVVVEVTETAVFDGGIAVDTLQNLVGLGVKVALDDFGTGHSSLGLLRTVPADTLKVDKSFVDGIGLASEEAVIATAMIQITDGLHLQAIAEGVETAEQAETLYRLGYRFAQGYHFSRPLSPEQVRERLDERAFATQ